MHLRRDFQSLRIQPDEAGGGVLVAGFGFHRGNCKSSLAGCNGEVLGKDRPAFMVFPASANFHQPLGKTFADKAATFGQRQRGAVVRLDVGFGAMEFKFMKGMFQNQPQPFTHQSPAGVGLECVIADEGALKISANDFVQVDDSDDAAGVPMDDKKPVMLAGLKFFQIFIKGRARLGPGIDPLAVNRTTPSDCGEKCVAVCGIWRADAYPVFRAAIQMHLFSGIFASIPLAGRRPFMRMKPVAASWLQALVGSASIVAIIIVGA